MNKKQKFFINLSREKIKNILEEHPTQNLFSFEFSIPLRTDKNNQGKPYITEISKLILLKIDKVNPIKSYDDP